MRIHKSILSLLIFSFIFQFVLSAQVKSQDNTHQNKTLWKAAKKGDSNKVKVLLDNGADPNATFRKGGNALLFASDRGHLDVIKVLLENGANVNAKEEQYGWNALIWAAYRGHHHLIPILLEYNIDVNAIEAQQNGTALWWAVSRGHEKFVGLLVKESKNLSSQTVNAALQAAEKYKNIKIIQFLKEAKENIVSQNWPSFRGPYASGIASVDQPVGVHWNISDMKNIKWAVPVPGLGLSSPIIWEDQIYLTSAEIKYSSIEFYDAPSMASIEETENYTWKLYCFDKKSGFILWSKIICEGKPKTKRHPKNSYASPTPVTNGKYIVAYFGSEGTYCFDMDGNLLWKKENGNIDTGWFYDPDYNWGVGASPVIYKDLVFIQSDVQENSYLIAYDLATGDVAWSRERDEVSSWCTPTIFENGIKSELITNGTNQIRSYAPISGEILWWINTGNSMTSVPTPIIHDSLVIITNGDAPKKPIYAIKLGGQGNISLEEGQKSNSHILWSKLKGGPYVSTPIVYKGYLYICTYNGVLACYDIRSGERKYRKRFEERQSTIFYASPVAAADKLYCISEKGIAYVIQAGPEYKLLAKNRLGEDCLSTPAISEGMIFIRTQSNNYGILYCIVKGEGS